MRYSDGTVTNLSRFESYIKFLTYQLQKYADRISDLVEALNSFSDVSNAGLVLSVLLILSLP